MALICSQRFSDGAPTELHLYEDSFGWTTALSRRVEMLLHLRVFEIHAETDWFELCRRFPMDVSGEKRHDGWAIEIDTGSATNTGTASVIAGWNPAQTWWFTRDTSLGVELTHGKLDESLHWRRVESCARDEDPPAGCGSAARVRLSGAAAGPPRRPRGPHRRACRS